MAANNILHGFSSQNPVFQSTDSFILFCLISRKPRLPVLPASRDFHLLIPVLFRVTPLTEADSKLLLAEAEKESACVTHRSSHAQMTDFKLSRDEFMKGTRELAVSASFSLKCHLSVSLGRTATSAVNCPGKRLSCPLDLSSSVSGASPQNCHPAYLWDSVGQKLEVTCKATDRN